MKISIKLCAAAAVLALPLCAGAGLQPRASTQITDRYGRPLRAYLNGAAASSCAPVKLQDVSPWLVLSTVAVEDKRFFSHAGVDFRSVARAFLQNSRKGRAVSGASTITQQLARALEPRPRTLIGKFTEMVSAFRLESGHSKEEILEAYFNSVSYGALLTGAEAASRAYFGLPVRDISLAQAALLAGIPKSPVNYDPYRRPREAFERQRLVLRRMLDLGLVDEENYRLALGEKILIKEKDKYFDAPHFSDHVLQRSPPGPVRTTLDLRVQEAAADALKNHLAGLSARNHVTNGAVLALDNATGGIIAWVGSADFFNAADSGQVDGVTSLRQPGSALKPFLYALALSRGSKASDIIEDEPLYSAGGHAPLNYDKTYHGKVRLREALACSYNVPAVRLAEKAGLQAFLSILRDFGFGSLDKTAEYYGSGLALGNGEVTLLELVNAYAALARGGIWLPARFSANGAGAPARRVMGAREAYIISSILSDNSARAPAFGVNSAFSLPFELAGKTGTTKDYRDNWAVGYTPEWTVGVWVGNFDGAPMRKVSGITGAAPILKDVALLLNKLYPSTRFKRPLGIKTVGVCPVSGSLPSSFCPASMEEIFTASNLPSLHCREHLAPSAPAQAVQPADQPAVKFPRDGDIFRIDPQTPRAAQALFFKAEAAGEELVWRVDSRDLAGSGESTAWPLEAGAHSVSFSFMREGRVLRSRPVKFMVIK
ncbi:MAG: penicillin-binding protein 1C [Elusimicrobia bacterium GWA2_61_42]|nr:MAG: penicillin-binding protein 1C [Elusimicrobia bacterium GWA2_61_42]OGR76445.1 MAG: penicillin-binding protein 1C [Elusimicrobia bacterium GWC2_61_25]